MRIKRHRVGIAASLSAAAFVLAGCGSSDTSEPDASGAQTWDTLNVGINHWVGTAATKVGIEEGTFEDAGFENVELQTTGAAPAVIAALQSNKVDISVLPSASFLDALTKGMDLTAIAPLTGFPADQSEWAKYDQFDLVVQPDSGITRPKDLEGKTVPTGARGDTMEMALSYMIKEDGGDPSKVKWIQLVGAPATEAFKAGRVDAAPLALPFTAQAQESGGKVLTQVVNPLFGGAPFLMWVGSPDLAKDPAKMEAVQNAILATNSIANADHDRMLEASAKEAGIDVKYFKERPENLYFPTEYADKTFEGLAQRMIDMGFLKEMPDLAKAVPALPDAKG